MIVGISGKIGSGKDTLAEMLRDIMRDKNFEIRKYAAKLKEVVSILTGCGSSDLESQSFKSIELPEMWAKYRLLDFHRDTGVVYGSKIEAESCMPRSNSQHSYTLQREPMTYRSLLQILGTEAIRNNVHPNTWVNALFSGYHGQNWLITDVRFPNEADAIKAYGGIVVRVNRPGILQSNHPSETMLDDYQFDEIVINDGDLPALMRKAEDLSRDIIRTMP